jgi:hypothetical protein
LLLYNLIVSERHLAQIAPLAHDYTMTQLVPEVWEHVLFFISDPHNQRMYGINKFFMATVFARKYRRVQLTTKGYPSPGGMGARPVLHIGPSQAADVWHQQVLYDYGLRKEISTCGAGLAGRVIRLPSIWKAA